MLCGARGSRGTAGAAGVCASTLVGWRGGVCARDWACGDVPQAPSFPLRLPEGCPQAFEEIRVVLGCGEVVGVDSLGMDLISQHGFPCGLWHRPPPPAGGGSSPPTPCGAGGPGPGGRALPGPTFATRRAACGSSAATTVHGRGCGLGRMCGCGCVWWGHGDWWRWWARGSPRSHVPWACAGSGGVGVRGPVGTSVRSPLRGGVGTRGGGGSGASAGRGRTSGAAKGAGTLLVGLGVAPVGSGVVRGLGVWALSGGGTRCIVPRPRRAPP